MPLDPCAPQERGAAIIFLNLLQNDRPVLAPTSQWYGEAAGACAVLAEGTRRGVRRLAVRTGRTVKPLR
jgi:hypothetical protein